MYKGLTQGLQAGQQTANRYQDAQYAHNLIAQEAKNQLAEADLQRKQGLLANLQASFATQQANYQGILDDPSIPQEIKLAAMDKLGGLQTMNAGISIGNVDDFSKLYTPFAGMESPAKLLNQQKIAKVKADAMFALADAQNKNRIYLENLKSENRTDEENQKNFNDKVDQNRAAGILTGGSFVNAIQNLYSGGDDTSFGY
jgi:hypothetical protein